MQTYEEFIAKFNKEQPKTTDDCYTPVDVYEKVVTYCEKTYGVDRNKIIRPFYPGGDFENEDYSGKIVVDNPPFSIIKKIIYFYKERNIPFFLFCSGITAPMYAKDPIPAAIIALAVTITYENGARVNTSFITNMEDTCIRTDPYLYNLIYEGKTKKKIKRPENYIHITDFNFLASRGVYFKITPNDVIEMHNKNPEGYKFFGRCLELSEEKTEEWKKAKEKSEQNGLPVKWL